ncbi:MAG: type II toxin-antitoxin system Phd/YefM family antitoxin [Candidatus Acidiferrales bacterium]
MTRAAGSGRKTWAVAQAKARLSEVISSALAEGPQTITRSGREAVVMVSVEDWKRKTKRKGGLVDFFAASPLRGTRLKIRRGKDRPRKIEV